MEVGLSPPPVHVQGTRRYGSNEAEPIDWIVPPFSDSKPGATITSVGLSEMFAYHATTMANTIKSSLLVFSRKVGPQAGHHTHIRACTSLSYQACW